MKITDVARRADGYGIPAAIVDGFDALAVFDALETAVARARSAERPDLRRVQDLSGSRPLHRRSRTLPAQGGGRRT